MRIKNDSDAHQKVVLSKEVNKPLLLNVIFTPFLSVILNQNSIFVSCSISHEKSNIMLKACFKKHTFEFITPGGTSRGVLNTKDSWYIIVYDDQFPDQKGIGECSLIYGLSIDKPDLFESKLTEVVNNIEKWDLWLEGGLDDFPAIRMGLETAIKDLLEGGEQILFPSEFTEGRAQIPINGLVWMGDYRIMKERVIEKINAGFHCIKIKIGAIKFDEEIALLKLIRKDFSDKDIEIRVDANGAFAPGDAMEKLNRLSEYNLHSIEQPVKPGQWDVMAELCRKSPLAIALDEELIGIKTESEIRNMLTVIKPQYIILKPSLLGGMRQSYRFIAEAEKQDINWWVTSALEGNIGLNAIAQWTYTLNNNVPQGLGTGMLFSNNIPSPLAIEMGGLFYDCQGIWDLSTIT